MPEKSTVVQGSSGAGTGVISLRRLAKLLIGIIHEFLHLIITRVGIILRQLTLSN